MSMIAALRRLSDSDLSHLQEKPELIADYLAEDPLDGFGPFADLDVDKAWHAIHFLLTGTAWEGEPPLNFLATGGTEIGDDLGYGPARGLAASRVRELAAALEPLPADILMERFNPAAFTSAEIYPEIWDRPPEDDDTRGYVAEYYDELRTFVIDAAVHGEALLISIT
jgi:hypothetical protein